MDNSSHKPIQDSSAGNESGVLLSKKIEESLTDKIEKSPLTAN